jgi:hypothetical protein
VSRLTGELVSFFFVPRDFFNRKGRKEKNNSKIQSYFAISLLRHFATSLFRYLTFILIFAKSQ